ncbi:sugar ABC transporter permease [Catellatospora sp. IY07-71]|uniref:ABC transporter permease subunit n=1 Tax=Catellatospora sp. IY07-71 TaxID=2728827 RepID=UPI001BB40617|nr:ABC transporter permease subunit [Catellatospora sp. IY07-71]BCJ72285.1 sugar ABC transporter permease [Catellatospora sp. IY07-71]
MTTQVAGAGSERSPHPGPSGQAPEQRNPRRGQGGEAEKIRRREVSTGFIVSRIAVLSIVAALLIYAIPPLLQTESWTALGVLGAVTAAVAYLYLTPRHVPAKYLVPGTIFLVAFAIVPIVLTFVTAFTNFGDGHRGTKEEAIRAIETSSVTQVPGSPEYYLTIAERAGSLVFLLVDPTTKAVQAGTADGLSAVDGAEVSLTGKVLSASGYTIVPTAQAAERDAEIGAFSVPTAGGAIKATGLSRAFEGKADKKYDAACDCIVNPAGDKWFADEAEGYFIDSSGAHLDQGWQVGVGFANFKKALTDPTVSGHFLNVLIWNFVFAISSVATTFALGMIVALALHHPRVRGTKIYRVLLILPYAMPSFAMLLIWRDMFNTDFGLISKLFGVHDWLGTPTTARLGLIVINLWMGFPYMFLVITGALQAVPKELTDAARIDGATPWAGFRRVTLPLVLVALTPLLISSFGFNFNNFNNIRLVTNGGPYAIDNATVGSTDLLISYTYRVAGFDSGVADFGFAAAISVFIFAIVATVSTVAFWRSRRQEEVYS